MYMYRQNKGNLVLSIILALVILLFSGAARTNADDICLEGTGFQDIHLELNIIPKIEHDLNEHPIWGQFAVPWRINLEITFSNGSQLKTEGDVVVLPGTPLFSYGVAALDTDGGKLKIREVETEIQTESGALGLFIYKERQPNDGVIFLEGYGFVDPNVGEKVKLTGGEEFIIVTPCIVN